MGRRKSTTVLLLVGVIGVMGTLTAFAAPLYQMFCRVTGYGGTTQVAAAPTVRFNTDVNSALPWRFRPAQDEIRVKLGEPATAVYIARSFADVPVTGSATFNVTPAKAGLYFNKIECFCFTRQTLAPGASAEMAISFFIAPEMAKDRNLDDVTTITLSYTFFKALRQESISHGGAAPARHAGSSVN